MSTAAPKSAARKMPKGGRKGGSIFSRVAFKDALSYTKKLVAKTHVAAQPQGVIHSGVVGARGGKGDVRISALKQYGFMEGDKAKGFGASVLAKKINSAPFDELK